MLKPDGFVLVPILDSGRPIESATGIADLERLVIEIADRPRKHPLS